MIKEEIRQKEKFKASFEKWIEKCDKSLDLKLKINLVTISHLSSDTIG